jgi:multidrug efflux pump subunit AcrA (membrane-fusion protein)
MWRTIKMSKEIFNQDALSRLRSPEQLDTMIRVTQPVIWMSIIVLCFLVGSIVLWSIYGVMSVSVESVGMIIDSAGVVNVYHDNSGRIEEIVVQPGKRVRKGDVVARISQPSIANDVIASRQDIAGAMNHQQVRSGISRFDSLLTQLYHSSSIISAYEGIVTEVAVNKGEVVTAGSTIICSIRQDQAREDLRAVMYVPVDSGKQVRPGMVVRLAPGGVNTQENGSLLGVVREVSLYPTSSSVIFRVIGNSNVVNWILQRLGEAVMEVKVDLVRDPKSKSGYLWSSIAGEHPVITPGTVCTGSIVVERRPPISKIFLRLSQWLRNS